MINSLENELVFRLCKKIPFSYQKRGARTSMSDLVVTLKVDSFSKNTTNQYFMILSQQKDKKLYNRFVSRIAFYIVS